MKTLGTMLLVTAVFMAVVVMAEPARQHQGSQTPPPAAPTTRGPNQTCANGPANHGTLQPGPQSGQPNRPTGQPNQRGGPMAPTPGMPPQWGTPGGPNHTPYGPQSGYQAPNSGARGWGQPAPNGPSGWERDQREKHGGFAPPPPPQQGPGKQPAQHGWNQPGAPRGPEHGYAPQRPQVPPPAPPQRYEGRDERYRGRDGNSVWRYAPLVAMVVRAFLPSDPKLMGAVIVGADDSFLGVISRDANDPESLANGWGQFGSPQSPYSIWNQDGRWGSRYAADSPWNPYATRPPRVFDGDEFRGYLTTNTSLHPRVDPEWLRNHLDVPRR